MSHIECATDAAEQASSAFEPLVDQLTVVRQSEAALTKAVDAFASAVAAREGRQAGGIDAACRSLDSQIRGVRSSIDKANFSTRFDRITSLAGQLRLSSRYFDALASLTSIVTSELSDTKVDRDALTKDIRGLAARLDRMLGHLETAIDAANVQQVQVKDRLTSAEGALDDSIGAADAATTEDDIPERDPAAGVLETAQDFSMTVKPLMSGMIACMQHPDKFRQRAEHVDRIVAMGDGAGDARRTLCLAVAAAHCHDMARELSEVIDTAQTALRRIQEAGAGTARDLDRQIAVDDRVARLEDQRASISTALAAMSRASQETRESLGGLDKMDSALTSITALFEELSQARESVRLSAFNASIVAQRFGTRASGIGAVAAATRDGADGCVFTIREMSEIMDAISAACAEIDTSALKTAFAEAEDSVRAEEARLNALIAETEAITRAAQTCGSTVAALVAATRHSVEALTALAPAVVQMDDLAIRLAAQSPRTQNLRDADLGDLLAQISALYSMDCERTAHATALEGLGLDAPAVAEAPDDDAMDLAAVLF